MKEKVKAKASFKRSRSSMKKVRMLESEVVTEDTKDTTALREPSFHAKKSILKVKRGKSEFFHQRSIDIPGGDIEDETADYS